MDINSLREYRQLYLNWLNVFLYRTHVNYILICQSLLLTQSRASVEHKQSHHNLSAVFNFSDTQIVIQKILHSQQFSFPESDLIICILNF